MKLKDHFVPVAVTCASDTPTTLPTEDEERAFYRRLGYLGNGTFLITPNARKLEGDMVLALKEYEKLPLSERTKLEDFGKPDPALAKKQPPPGSVILKMYRRTLGRDEGGQLFTPTTLIHYESQKESAPMQSESQRDYLWLTEKEWRSLIPAGCKKGESFAVSPSIVDRIGRYYLIDATSGITQQWFWKPGDVLSQQLTGTVVECSDERIRILLGGKARYTKDGKGPEVAFKIQGVLDYSPGKRSLERFDMTAEADAAHWRANNKPYEPLGVAFELAKPDDPLATKTTPFFLGEPGYFGAGK